MAFEYHQTKWTRYECKFEIPKEEKKMKLKIEDVPYGSIVVVKEEDWDDCLIYMVGLVVEDQYQEDEDKKKVVKYFKRKEGKEIYDDSGFDYIDEMLENITEIWDWDDSIELLKEILSDPFKVITNPRKCINITRVNVPEPHVITIDGKEIEISEESYNKLKESLV